MTFQNSYCIFYDDRKESNDLFRGNKGGLPKRYCNNIRVTATGKQSASRLDKIGDERDADQDFRDKFSGFKNRTMGMLKVVTSDVQCFVQMYGKWDYSKRQE